MCYFRSYMAFIFHPVFFLSLSLCLLSACDAITKPAELGKVKNNQSDTAVTHCYQYIPDSPELHDSIVRLDSILFDAYNNCKLDIYDAMFSEDFEFYHDKNGLSTSKKDMTAAVKKNICGKVTRELVKGSIEVYPIHGFGAIEMGMHCFRNKEENNNAPSSPGKFIVVWKKEDLGWKATRVISLH